MNPWIESAAVAMLAVFGTLLGRRSSRLPKPWWTIGYFIPLALIVTYGLAMHFPALSFTPPVAWMMMGRNKFAVIGFVAAMVLTTPLMKLPRKRERAFVAVVMKRRL